jgi:hypothetical protein
MSAYRVPALTRFNVGLGDGFPQQYGGSRQLDYLHRDVELDP